MDNGKNYAVFNKGDNVKESFLNARIGAVKGRVDFFVANDDEEPEFIVSVERRGMGAFCHAAKRARQGFKSSFKRIDKLEGYEDEIHDVRIIVDSNRDFVVDLINSSYDHRLRCYIPRSSGILFLDGLTDVAREKSIFSWAKCEIEELKDGDDFADWKGW